MNALLQRRLVSEQLAELVATAPVATAQLTEDHRRSLAARLHAVPTVEHRRLDAWSVEQGGQSSSAFQWSARTAKRLLGNAALRRVGSGAPTPLEAVRDEIADQLVRVTRGTTRAGSLAYWLAGLGHAELALVSAEAVNWAIQGIDCLAAFGGPGRVASTDAYYDVAGARTTLRGRRDLVLDTAEGRLVVRIRSGSPGKSAGPGLRSDLVAETLAHADGVAPQRFIGLWPDAGLVLAVDGTMEDLRAGARDLVRAAVVQRRQRLVAAA